MAHIRTFNPSVRVGNWFEDKQLEEDALKEFLEKRDNGQLLVQRVGKLSQNLNSENCSTSGLTVSTDSQLKFGDRIQLINPGADQRLVELCKANCRNSSVLSIGVGLSAVVSENNSSICSHEPCTASQDMKPSHRNILIVSSCDGSSNGQAVTFGQPFQLVTQESGLFLSSDSVTFGNAAKKSRHQAVSFTRNNSFLTHWRTEYFNPQLRMEFEYTPIPVNEKLIIKHVKTNQALAVEEYIVHGLFGPEFEISTNTFIDEHKAERDLNHWIFHTNIPDGAAY